MNENDLLKGLNHIDDRYIEQAQYSKKPRSTRPALLRWISAAAVLCLILALLWPQNNVVLSVQAEDLMAGITARPVETADLEGGTDAVADFAVRLLQASNKAGENTLVSPVSVLYALAMTANGAEGDTLEEMEAVLGMPVDELNTWLHSYTQTIDESQLKLANSIWFTNHDRFAVNPDFLQRNADYYGADIYQAPFDDTTLQDINNWVDHKTNGMIPEMLDQIPDDAVMYLINALCFEAKWAARYEDDQIRPDTFTKEDGTELQVDFLNSEEEIFLKDDLAKGFLKAYKGGKYAFAAMLPNEGVTVEQYLDSLTGASLQALLDSADNVDVRVSMPKFETGFSLKMNDALKQMGIEQAFDKELADFSGLGTSGRGNIFIDQVLHKTYICVDEQGTRAAASTLIGMNDTTSLKWYETVDLDRPFVYMILDTQTGLPVFIGTMMDPGN